MDKNALREIVLEQKQNIFSKDKSVLREMLAKIERNIKLPHSIVITGMRRVGKSTLLFQIIKYLKNNKLYYFNFEDERLINFSESNFNDLYEILLEFFGDQKTFFFDEIQNIFGWENFIRRMQDRGFKFFLTGSNASMLSRELGSKLTGRYISYELYPFSFKEFLDFKNYKLSKNPFFRTKERAKLKFYFNKYLREGGMPEYLKYNNREILKKLYEDILYRDIVARYDIKEVKSLRELALYYFSNLSSLISFNKLKESLKLGSVNTVKNYTDYFENSFLFFAVNIFSYKLTQQFIAPKKIYCIDNGLAEAVAFNFSKNTGRYLENLVFVELKRRGKEIFYYKTKNNQEIDFVLRKGTKITDAIQVTDNLSDKNIKNREIKALLVMLDEQKLKYGTILTRDEKEIIKIDNKIITIVPVYEWLLDD